MAECQHVAKIGWYEMPTAIASKMGQQSSDRQQVWHESIDMLCKQGLHQMTQATSNQQGVVPVWGGCLCWGHWSRNWTRLCQWRQEWADWSRPQCQLILWTQQPPAAWGSPQGHWIESLQGSALNRSCAQMHAQLSVSQCPSNSL